MYLSSQKHALHTKGGLQCNQVESEYYSIINTQLKYTVSQKILK